MIDFRVMTKGVACATVALLGIAAAPASANNAAAASAAIEFADPVDGAAESPLASGDAQFRELFASWKDLAAPRRDSTSPIGVSVPSRMPLDDATLTSGFGMRTHPVLGGRRAHSGIDLAAPVGTPVYATADGVVSRADRFSSYGNFISIEHGGNLQTRFAHLSGFAVSEGDHVHKGQLIGYVGSTGRSTGPHLHYEVRVEGGAVNPVPYMVETDAQHAFALAEGPGGQGGGD